MSYANAPDARKWLAGEGYNMANYKTKNHNFVEKDKEKEEEYEDWLEEQQAEYCYECGGYGDDYYTDADGNLVSACTTCPFGGYDDWDD